MHFSSSNGSAGLAAGQEPERTDGQLLGAFLATRDEAAFEEIVRRHGPLVFGVCRRLLGNEQDAADAFQAVFVVLARKAGSIRAREALGAWLYHVAYRTSMKARSVLLKRRAREGQVSVMPEPAVAAEAVDDVLEVLDEELRAMPTKYSQPIILCDLQGHSRKSAATLLRLAEGTISSRLATGRRKLADRLKKRGVTVSATALATILAQNVAQASVPPAVVTATIKSVVSLSAGKAAAGLSSTVLVISDGVLRSMFLAKLQLLVLALLVPIIIAGVVQLTLAPMAEAPDERALALAMLERLGAKLRWDTRPTGKELVAIDLRKSAVTDNDVKRLVVFSELRELVLSETAITDASAPTFAQLRNLRSLRFGATGASDSCVEAAASLPSLEMLSASWTHVTDAGVRRLAGHAALQQLDLRNTAITDASLAALGTCANLQILEAGKTKITDVGLTELTKLAGLKAIRLEHDDLTDAAVRIISGIATLDSLSLEGNHAVTDAALKNLQSLPLLGALNLTGTAVTDAGVVTLGKHPTLAWLSLDHTAVTGAGFEKLETFPKLRKLFLNGTKVTDATLPQVASQALLQQLALGQNPISDAGLAPIATLRDLDSLWLEKTGVTDACIEELSHCPKLTFLELNGTAVTDAFLARLADMVRARTAFVGLQSLHLHKTEVTDDGLKHLPTLSNLQSLWLSWTQVTDAGLPTIARLTKLRSLRLGGCPISDAGLASLRPLRQLRSLWLDWTQVTDAGLTALAEFRQLDELRLDGSGVTTAGRNELPRLRSQKTSGAAPSAISSRAPLANPNAAVVGTVGTVRVLKGHKGPVHELCFTRDGKRLLSGSGWPGNEASVRLWDLATGQQIWRVSSSGQVSALELSQDGKIVLAGCYNTIHGIEVETGQILFSVKNSPKATTCSIVFAPEQRHFYTTAQDGFARRWNLEERKEVARYKVDGKWARYAGELPDGRVITADSDRNIQIWDRSTAEEVRRFSAGKGWMGWARLTPEGTQIFAGHYTPKLWDVATGNVIHEFESHKGDLTHTDISPDGKKLLTTGFDGVARLYDFQSRELLKELHSQEEFLFTAVFSPDGNMVAVAGGGRKEGKNFLPGSMHDIHLFNLSAATAPSAVAEVASAPIPNRRWLILAAAISVVAVAAFGFALLRERKTATKGPEPAAALTFACPACGKRLKARAALAGSKVKCPSCAAAASVPSAPGA